MLMRLFQERAKIGTRASSNTLASKCWGPPNLKLSLRSTSAIFLRTSTTSTGPVVKQTTSTSLPGVSTAIATLPTSISFLNSVSSTRLQACSTLLTKCCCQGRDSRVHWSMLASIICRKLSFPMWHCSSTRCSNRNGEGACRAEASTAPEGVVAPGATPVASAVPDGAGARTGEGKGRAPASTAEVLAVAGSDLEDAASESPVMLAEEVAESQVVVRSPWLTVDVADSQVAVRSPATLHSLPEDRRSPLSAEAPLPPPPVATGGWGAGASSGCCWKSSGSPPENLLSSTTK
mmetsp:Transcript_52447/g.170293  ORF Transcript_52447/g.170293 Transcript_52447/m.170293 type:complete len:291 (-) Transcript_52447:410-1282(-)